MDIFWQITIVEFLLNLAVIRRRGHRLRTDANACRALVAEIEITRRVRRSASCSVIATAVVQLMPVHLSGGGSRVVDNPFGPRRLAREARRSNLGSIIAVVVGIRAGRFKAEW